MAVKLCNETITVFNRRWNDDLGDDVYYPTTITGASWYATQAQTVDPKGGLVMANKVVIRIPKGAAPGYLDPIAYKAAESPAGAWTLDGGTIIIKGEATGTSWTPTALKAAFVDCMTVLGVTDNRRAPNAPHFKVVGG